jgi:ATP-binding cassette subfamily B protein
MIQTIKRIIRWTGGKGSRLYWGFLWSFLSTMFTAMPIMGVAYLLSLMLEDKAGQTELTPIWAIYAFVFMAVMILGRFLFSYLRATFQDSIGYEVTEGVRIKIGDILKRVSLGFFVNHNAGEIAGAVTTDLSFFEMFAMKMVDTTVNGYISTLTMTFCLSFYSIPIALISLFGVALSAFFLRLLGARSRRNAPAHQKSQDDMVAATLEYVRGIPVVKAYGQEGASIQGIRRAYHDSRFINVKIEWEYAPFNGLHLLSLKLSSAAIVAVAAMLALNGEVSVPVFLMFAVFSFVNFAHVEQVNHAAHVLRVIESTMNKLEKIEQAKFIDETGKDKTITRFDIQMCDVSFGYDSRKVLKDVTFYIPQNTTTAIVGPSGSGKTTICGLIARFYDVDSGAVTIGGVDVRELTCDSLLSHISMVFQNVYLFHDTVRNNIRFGKPDATDAEIIEAAKNAMCHDFITALPEGYDTVVGEGGSSLSGGEKQRISIARALLKNAPIVILDEATASVDPENEHLIQRAISALTHGKTIIVIAHRLATIENADQILVMDDGRIAQRGTHGELVTQDGLYRRFVDIRERAEGWSIV